MKNDLTESHLNQDITVTLPLSAVLRLGEPAPIALSAEVAFTNPCHRNIGDQGAHGIYAGLARADE